MTENVSERIAKLEEMVADLWDVEEVRRENEAFTPSTKNYHLRKSQRIQNMQQQPNVSPSLYGIWRGIVLDTRDPLCTGRVKVYVPVKDKDIPFDDILWAEHGEAWGSLEDQGSVFTPPAGSTVLVQYEAGDRTMPIVTHCLWNNTRLAGNAGLLLLEEQQRWGGAPGVRVMEKNKATNPDENHLTPPWNNESYDTRDNASSTVGFSHSLPHIAGFKSPEKHFLQMVDGDNRSNLKGKRFVMQSSRGNVLFMKDDGINRASQLFENEMWDDFTDAYPGLRSNNKRPYNDHQIELDNTGVQLQSYAGHRLILNDEREKPEKDNSWWTQWSPGDKTARFRTFITLQSVTEHKIILSDHEKLPKMRDAQDGIFGITATGHYFGMQDDTDGENGGIGRAIILHSTSGHKLEMNDYTVKVASPRKGDSSVYWSGGVHNPSARLAFVSLKSGWGQEIRLDDMGSQQENADQYIEIRNYNKDDNYDCKPDPPFNLIRMNCVTGDRLFHTWAAGRYLLRICHNSERYVIKGSERVGIFEGARNVSVHRNIFEMCNTGIVHWTVTNQIKLLVGRLINDKLEFPPYPVMLFQGQYGNCPYTTWMHWKMEPSKHVFASI